MGNTFYFGWEVALMEFLQAHMGAFAAQLASFVSMFGEELFTILVLGFLYWVYDKKIGLRFGMNVMMAQLAFPLIKNIALRRRPYMDHEGIRCLKLIDKNADAMDIAAQGYSFPSGHSANSAVTMGTLAAIFRKPVLTVLAVVIPLLVGISRFCLGVHYPTDVLAGWAIGALAIFVTPALEKRFEKKQTFYLIVFLVASVGIFYCRSNDYFSSLGMMLGLLLGSLFEERFVRFRPTRNVPAMILRTIGGITVYFGLNMLLKLPFSDELLASATPAQFAVRFVRYAIILFVEVGVYPLLFGRIIREKKDGETAGEKTPDGNA